MCFYVNFLTLKLLDGGVLEKFVFVVLIQEA